MDLSEENTKLTEKVVESLKRKGLPIVKTDVKVGRNRFDIIASSINEEGDIIPEVVAEVSRKPNPASMQQLMKYVQALKPHYALLATAEKEYWYDGQTFAPIDVPTISHAFNFLKKEDDISSVILLVIDQFRGSFRYQQITMILLQALLVRAYFEAINKIELWWSIKNEVDFFQHLNEAIRHYSLNLSPAKPGFTDETIQFLINQLGSLPGTSPVLQKVLLKVWENKTTGQYLSPEQVRDLFANITKVLVFNKNKVIDLAAGLGSIAFEVAKANNIPHFVAFESQKDTCNLLEVLTILGGYSSVTAICADTLQQHEKLQENSYSLVLLDPPLGMRYMLAEEQLRHFQIAKNASKSDVTELFIERALEITESEGYILALVPERVLFSGSSQITRDLIKKKTIIEAIISLPVHTLKPYTMVKTSLLVLRKKRNSGEFAKELFLARADRIDEFTEIVEKFAEWKRSRSIRG